MLYGYKYLIQADKIYTVRGKLVKITSLDIGYNSIYVGYFDCNAGKVIYERQRLTQPKIFKGVDHYTYRIARIGEDTYIQRCI